MSKRCPFSIILFLDSLSMGGAERVMLTLAKGLVHRGHQVDLVLAQKSGPLLCEVDPALNVIDLGVRREGQPNWLFGLRTLWKLSLYLRQHPPNVLLTTITGSNIVAILARKLSGQNFRIIIREAVTLDNTTSPLRRWAMRGLYPAAEKIVALTDYMKDQLITDLRLPPEKLVVIGNPLDKERITTLAQDRTEKVLIDAYQPYLIAVGRLVPQKDFSNLIRAAAKLPDMAPNLIVIGDGPERPELERLINDNGLQGRVHLIGFRANPYPWLSGASGFVLSSRWEGYPNVILEAMQFALPIVATTYDQSVNDLMEGYPSAHHQMVPVSQPAALADAIADMLVSIQSGEAINSRVGVTEGVEHMQKVIGQYENLLSPPTQRGQA